MWVCKASLLLVVAFVLGCQAQDEAENVDDLLGRIVNSDDYETQGVLSLWEGLSKLKLRRSHVDGWELLRESRESRDSNSFFFASIDDSNETNETNVSDVNDTNASNLSTSTLQTLQAVTQLIVGPAALFKGQDVEQMLHVVNGLLVGGLNELMTRLQSLNEIDPMAIVSIFSTLTAAVGSIACTVQNPAAGARVQGGVIFKQLSGMLVSSYYFSIMNSIGQCKMISHEITSKYPHGVPEDCSQRLELPFNAGTIEGSDVALYIVTSIEYGLVAVGAALAPTLALFMTIFNAASLGANMLIRALTHFIVRLLVKYNVPEEEIKIWKLIIDGYATQAFTFLVIIGFVLQLLLRKGKKKSDGAGPFQHVRFKALESRNAKKPAWASIDDLRFTFHGEEIDIPEAFGDPPDEGTAEWLVTFERATNITAFCFSTPDDKLDDDPVSFVLEASSTKGTDAPQDPAAWVVVHESKKAKIPKARNARTQWFELKASQPAAASSSSSRCHGFISCFKSASTAASKVEQTENKGAPSSEAAAKGSRSSAAKGVSAADKAVKHATAVGAKDVESGAIEAEGAVSSVAEKAGEQMSATVEQAQQGVSSVTSKLNAVAKKGKRSITFVKAQSQNAIKYLMVPFHVANETIKDSTDQTAGQDSKSMQELVMNALQRLGWDTDVFKFLIKRGLKTLLGGGSVVSPATIQKIVDHANEEELESLATEVSNLAMASFVADLKEVIRKLSEEEDDLKEELSKVEAKLESGLRVFLREKSALAISNEFHTTWASAYMMLLTLPTIKKSDGSVILKGHFDELQPQVDTSSGMDKALSDFFGKMSSGKPYEGREAHVTQMQDWLQQDKKNITEFFIGQFGKYGRIFIKLDPILAAYPQLKRQYLLLKQDPSGQMMKRLNKIKAKILKLLKRKASAAKDAVSKVEATAKDAVGKVEATAKDAVGKAETTAEESAGKVEAAAEGTVNKVEAKVGKVEKEVKKSESEAEEKVRKAGGLDIEAQEPAKALASTATHGAPPADLQTPLLTASSGSPGTDKNPQQGTGSASAEDTGEDDDDFGQAVAKQNHLKICTAALHHKLGLTMEEAQRLASYMTEEHRWIAAAFFGGILLPVVLKLAKQHEIKLNRQKCNQMQEALQKSMSLKQAKKNAAPGKRRKAAKAHAQMGAQDIKDQMKAAESGKPLKMSSAQQIKMLLKENERLRAELHKHDPVAAVPVHRHDTSDAQEGAGKASGREGESEWPDLDMEQDPDVACSIPASGCVVF